jgi:hypothetical protein
METVVTCVECDEVAVTDVLIVGLGYLCDEHLTEAMQDVEELC